MKQLITVGQPAPDFTAKDVMGNTVKLSKFHPKSVLVVFLRYSGCPWCNLALHRLTMEYPLLVENNCDVIAFIQSTNENVKENIYERHARKPPFPIIADPDKFVYKKYGVGSSVLAAARSVTKIPYWVHAVREHGFKQEKIDGDLFLVPAMFLVSGHSGKVLLASYSSSFYDHETFSKVYAQLGFVD